MGFSLGPRCGMYPRYQINIKVVSHFSIESFRFNLCTTHRTIPSITELSRRSYFVPRSARSRRLLFS